MRPDFAARRAYYASDLRRRYLEAVRATSAIAFEGVERDFGATLSFYATAEDAAGVEERELLVQPELDGVMATFGEFTTIADVRGRVLGAIRVDAPTAGAPAVIGLGRVDPPPPVPGQQTLFLTRLRADDGTEVLVHVATVPPRDSWPAATFLGRAVVVHVDRGDSMP